jgi:hypothetical protein
MIQTYFFHTADGGRLHDRSGMKLAGKGEARKEAIRFLGSILGDEPDLLWDGRDFRVEVTNEAGDLLFTVIALAVDAPAAE